MSFKQHLNIGYISEGDTVWATLSVAKWVWSPFLSILGSGATALQRKFAQNIYY